MLERLSWFLLIICLLVVDVHKCSGAIMPKRTDNDLPLLRREEGLCPDLMQQASGLLVEWPN